MHSWSISHAPKGFILGLGSLWVPLDKVKKKSSSPRQLNASAQVEPNLNSIEAGRRRRQKPNLSLWYKSDTYSCNCEIINLGRCGKVKDARKLFDDMPQRDAVSYASMINVYLKNDDLPNAQRLFQAMPTSNIVAESAMVSGYVKAGRIAEARQVFDRMENRNVYSWTSLISGYLSCGQVDEARRLFGRMPVKNVVSWTTMILGYARNNMIDEAHRVFNLMPERNTVSWTVMIKALIENDQFDDALCLFNDMPQRNLYSWNIIILGLLNANRVSEAIKLFSSMPQRNAISWTTMVTGLAHNKMTKLAREYFDRMPNKDVAAWNAMIASYVDEGLMAEAGELFSFMHERNVVTWNLMIDGYTKSGPKEQALKHLILMLRFCFRPNGTTIASVLSSCEDMMELMQAHALVLSHGFEHDTVVVNTLVTMYSRNGDVTSARFVFDHLGAKDVASWNAMILAYSNHGYGHHALQVFAHMLRSGAKPDDITFVGVLSACSHAGLVNKGQRLFNSMNHVCGIEPKAQHYSCLVDILGRAGLVDEATKVVRMMPASEKDAAVLGALLGAYRFHGNITMASLIGEALQELEPGSSGGYVLLAIIYAARGKWDEFARVRKKMKERNVNKVPGFSQIQVKGRSHVFFVGDKSHPQAAEIWGLLQEKLLPHMWEMGYSKRNASQIDHQKRN
ncbi:pentatricopeptide repeat-containing protein At4g02750-like [Rosa rugosa]|uniref:pentatricopeptide repeat-containing protein At4g02750-like n=1 Tax=Rosa rugosa TaxID=74645 RepID=UPI002B40EAD7|nr:pentatricopeptide repeat-containing protein At4g02750-like [Rosa rugosa]